MKNQQQAKLRPLEDRNEVLSGLELSTVAKHGNAGK